MRYKVCMIGHFAFGLNMLDGQTIKTKIVAQELEKRFGTNNIIKVDTHGGMKRVLSIFFRCSKYFLQSDNIIMLPAHNGLLFFTPMLYFYNLIFKKKLHYIVIGGWLPTYLKQHEIIGHLLKNFHKIYVETPVMSDRLKEDGFNNIDLLYNCKPIKILDEKTLEKSYHKPYRFCTFSRVTKEKGIEDAINSITEINESARFTLCKLDIYGPIDSEYRKRFYEVMDKCPKYIEYKGKVDFDKSTEILKGYYALLFPTNYKTEGIPGTIIDALAAGIPTIAKRWDSAELMVEHKTTGYIYPSDEVKNLTEAILLMIRESENIIKYKKASAKKAKDFIPENALDILVKNLN